MGGILGRRSGLARCEPVWRTSNSGFHRSLDRALMGGNMPEHFSSINSTLSADALLRVVLPAFSIGAATRCRLHYIGVNDTYVVTTADTKRYVLRVYRAAWHTLDNILYELDALLHLRDSGVPVSFPLPLRNGQYAYPIEAPEGQRYAVLFTYADGREPTYEDRSEAVQYGRAVALMHEASDAFSSLHSRRTLDEQELLYSPLSKVGPFLASRPVDQEYLARLSERLRVRLDALPVANLEKGFCHGDLHGVNAGVDGDGTVTFYDFDCCGTGWRAYDLAVFRWSAILRGNEKDMWPAYLEGYHQRRSLGELDLSAVPLFVAVRHIWTMGLNASIAGLFGDSWVNISYFDRELGFVRRYETEILRESQTG